MGYDVTLTKTTRDGGADILASIKNDLGKFLYLIDAKKYSEKNKIGVDMVRTLLGTLADYQASSAMLVTTSSFTKDARAMEKRHQWQLALHDYIIVAEWIQKHGTVPFFPGNSPVFPSKESQKRDTEPSRNPKQPASRDLKKEIGPGTTDGEILPTYWQDLAEERRIPEDHIFRSWRRSKDVSEFPYTLENWKAWISRE
jgi:Restriction endonuclease